MLRRAAAYLSQAHLPGKGSTRSWRELAGDGIGTSRRAPLTIDEIRVACGGFVPLGGDGVVSAAHDSRDATDAHQSAHLIAAHHPALAAHRVPEFSDAVHTAITVICRGRRRERPYASTRAEAETEPAWVRA